MGQRLFGPLLNGPLPKLRLLEGAETFLATEMARAIARAILGPKKAYIYYIGHLCRMLSKNISENESYNIM
jgi:hypothetical protein